MKEIALTNGGVTLVDDEDFERLSQHHWSRHAKGYVIRYASRTVMVWMHREIMGLPRGDKRCVDHINGAKADNQRSNLRVCTRSQNNMNRAMQGNNKSGFKGVYWCRREEKWLAKVRVDGKRITVGAFDTAESASEAYKAAATQYYGEFACFSR
jgi:hypothetical protein